MITCKICNRKFKAIKVNHLAKHGLTREEYIFKFPEEILESKESLENARSVHSQRLDKTLENVLVSNICGQFKEETGLNLLDRSGRLSSNVARISKYAEVFIRLCNLDETDLSAREACNLLKFGLTKFPKCLTCGTPVKIAHKTGFRFYCSIKCGHVKGAETFKKAARTNLVKYGVTCNLALPSNIELLKRNGGLGMANQKTAAKIKHTLSLQGVINPGQLPKVKEKIKNTMNERYGGHHNKNMSEEHRKKLKEAAAGAIPKRRKQMEVNGYWIPLAEVPNITKYRREVWKYTNKNAHLIPGYDQSKRGLCSKGSNNYQIDHKLSITDGYLQNISPEIIAHPENLQFIPWQDNLLKWAKSSITKEELYLIISNSIS